MVITLGSVSMKVLELLLQEKKTAFEQAFHKGRPITELNKIYAELKAVQTEINLREAADKKANR
jgi:hypothetical protein